MAAAVMCPARADGQPATNQHEPVSETPPGAVTGAEPDTIGCPHTAPPWWPAGIAIVAAGAGAPETPPCVYRVRLGPGGVAFVLLPEDGVTIGVAPPGYLAAYELTLVEHFRRLLVIRPAPGASPPPYLWLAIQLRTRKVYAELAWTPDGEPVASLAVLHHEAADANSHPAAGVARGGDRAEAAAGADPSAVASERESAAPARRAPDAALPDGPSDGRRWPAWDVGGVLHIARMVEPTVTSEPMLAVTSGLACHMRQPLTGPLRLDVGVALAWMYARFSDTIPPDEVEVVLERGSVVGRVTADVRVQGETRWSPSVFAGAGVQVRALTGKRVRLPDSGASMDPVFAGPIDDKERVVSDAMLRVGAGVERTVSRRVRLSLDVSFTHGFPGTADTQLLLLEAGLYVNWL